MIIIGILIIGLILRLILINQSFWLDEAIQVLESSVPFSKVWQIPVDFHPPLFHYLAYFWLKLGRVEWVARLLPVVLALGSIFFLYLFIKRLINKKAAIISSLFLATSPFHIYYSQEFRPYMLSCFLATASLFFFMILVKSNTRFNLPFIIINLLGLYSLYFFPFILIAQMAVVLLFFRKRIADWFLNIFISSLFFLPWLPMFLKQLQIGQGWAGTFFVWRNSVATPLAKSLPLVFIKFWLGNISFDNIFLYGLIALSLLLFTFFLIIKSWQAKKKETLLLLTLLIIPVLISFIISFFVPIIAPKRLLLIVPLFFALLSLGISSLEKKKQIAVVSLVVLINLSSLLYYAFNPRFQREQWREAVTWVESRAINEKSIVLFEFSSPFGPWTYYQKKNIQTVGVFDQDFKSINETMPYLTQGKNQVFLFQYLYEMTDLKKTVAGWLENNHYLLNKEIDFPGVGLIYEYQKNY